MGLFTALVTLPLAPVRGVGWVVQQVAEEAERQLYDESGMRRELLQLELDRDTGLLSEEAYRMRADELLAQIAQARERRAGSEPGPTWESDDG